MTNRHELHQNMSFVTWRVRPDNEVMKNRTTPRRPSEQAVLATEWRRLLGPGHQVAVTSDHILRGWKHPVGG